MVKIFLLTLLHFCVRIIFSSTELIPVLPTARKNPRPLVRSDCDIVPEQKPLHCLLLGSLISSTCLKDPREF